MMEGGIVSRARNMPGTKRNLRFAKEKTSGVSVSSVVELVCLWLRKGPRGRERG